jgi:serine/threonine protein kinase
MAWLSDRTFEHLAHLPTATVVGDRYEIREEIGRGGMGTVFRAFDRELERDVAIKILSTASPGTAARILKEARILGRLEHPGIIPIHDVGTMPDGRVFYVMKLVRGSRLDRAGRAGSFGDRLRIFDRLCDAVAFAHAYGVVHRDLKPENIMIGAFGEVLVLDWGVAKINAPMLDSNFRCSSETPSDRSSGPWLVEGGRTTAHGTVLGTPGYMAPEQAVGDAAHVDARADVFALGGILAFLLCGATDVQPDAPLPRALMAIVRRARQTRMDDRYPSTEALAMDVKRFASGLAVSAYHEGLLERTRRVVSRYRTAILLVAVYLVMRVLLLIVAGG